MLMKDCVFCKIVRGEIPCARIYEDDLALCFLDIAPWNPGHALLIPKEHHTSLTTVPPPLAGHLFGLVPRLANAMTRATGSDGFNLLLSNGACAGQVVPHAHLHIIPRGPEDGLVLPARNRPYASEAARAELLAKVADWLAKHPRQ